MSRCEPGCGEMGVCHANLTDEVEALAVEAYRAAIVLRGLASAGFNDSKASRRSCQNLARALARAIAKAGKEPPIGLVKPASKQETRDCECLKHHDHHATSGKLGCCDLGCKLEVT